jgi:hypothetical protein
MNGLRVAALQSDKRWPETVNSAVAYLVVHGAVEVGAVERLDLSDSLDITQRYWRRTGLTGAECEQQLGDWDRFAGRMLRG